jgi:phytoene dehydrogenase-like protein
LTDIANVPRKGDVLHYLRHECQVYDEENITYHFLQRKNMAACPSVSSEKSIIIIGAGVAGLAAGCYALMNGYRTTIFEMHNLPGGLCTAWDRKQYTFDGAIHYLFGSGVGQPFNQMWQELGIVKNYPMLNHEEYIRITDGKQTLIVYADPDRLEQHMGELSPADRPLIHQFCNGVRAFADFDMFAMYEKPRSLMNLRDWQRFGQKMTPFLMPLLRWALLPTKAFADRFRDPFLRRAVAQMFSWEEAPLMMGMFLLAYMHNGNAGFPCGGSLKFARALENRYLELGGDLHYNSQVEKILTKDGRAVGVRLYDDNVYTADYIISAADGHRTIFDMLDGQYTNRLIRRMYDGHLPILSQVQISLGLNRDLSNQPHWTTYLLDEPLLIIGEPRREVSVHHYGYDPSLTPTGKSTMVMMIRSSYAYWQHIYGRKLYDTEQRQVTDILLDQLEYWYPAIKADVEHKDEATPLSYERYTGNWMGSTCGWLLTRQTMPMLIRGVQKTLPGLDHFYMAGHWVEPGGSIPLAAASGRNAIQLICHQDGKSFEAYLPSPESMTPKEGLSRLH